MSSSSKDRKNARKQAQEELAAQRAAQKASDRRRSILLGIGVVVVIALIVGAVVIALTKQNKANKDAGPLPKGANSSTFGIVVGSGPVAYDSWEDFQCPSCKAYEDRAGSTVDQLVKDGKITITYHPLSFLDQNLNNDSSFRAANAAGCAADAGKFVAFHNEVYKNQPEKEGTGYTDQQLIDFGKSVGITSSSFADCVTTQKYAKWVKAVQTSGNDAGISSTPTIKVNGRELKPTDLTPEGITAAVAAAKQG